MNAVGPCWLPTNKAKRIDLTPAAWFAYDFDRIAAHYGARPTLDRAGGGAGPVRFFFLKLSHRRFAEFAAWERKPLVELSLKVNARGVVFWEDFEEVMAPLEVRLEEVRRQGAWHWRRRRPASAAAAERWRS